MRNNERALTADPEHSHTLSAKHYYDPEIFEQEKDAIFYRTWQFVGHVSQVSNVGDYLTLDLFDESIVVIRAQDEELTAYYNVCSHRAHRLLEGAGNTTSIVCPYHTWTYHLDGRLRHARNSENVSGFKHEEYCLKSVRIEILAGFVFINLDREAVSLKEQSQGLEEEILRFAPDVAALKFSRRLSYDLRANWKNVMENFSECYHCANAHQDLVKNTLDVDSYRIETHELYHSHRSRGKQPDEAVCHYDKGRAAQGSEFAAWYLWPNICFEVYPGGFVNTFHVLPSGAERSLENVDYFFFDEVPSADEQAVVDYRDRFVQAEDVRLVENVQRGLRSAAYTAGRLMVDPHRSHVSEHAVHHIQWLARCALEQPLPNANPG